MARILIVEDNKNTNLGICEYLKSKGHSAAPAYDGEQALMLFARRSPGQRAPCGRQYGLWNG